MGVEIKTEQFVAVVGCNHGNEKANRDYLYEGRQSCSSAKLLYGGQLQCKYGCLGFGDCANVCNYEAIKVVDGVKGVYIIKKGTYAFREVNILASNEEYVVIERNSQIGGHRK